MIIREEGLRLYAITLLVLLYFEWFTLAMFYSYIAVSSFMSEEDVDEYLDWDAEMYQMFEVYFTLRPFDEVDGLVLLDWEVEELLDQAIDDPKFPNSYSLIDSYRLSFCNNKNLTKYILPNQIEINELASRVAYGKQKVLQSKLVVSEKFNSHYYAVNFVRKYSLIKFKSYALIVNTFLIESLVYRGIYPYTEYDFEMYISKSQMFNQLFLECLLITETPLTEIKHLFDFKNDTETLVTFIFEEVLPEDYQLENFVEGRTEDLYDERDDYNPYA